MPFSRCQDVINRVSEIVDGEAGSVARTRFFAHLGMCSDCRRYYRQFRDVKEAAGVVQPSDLPSDFDKILGGVLAAIDAGSAPPTED